MKKIKSTKYSFPAIKVKNVLYNPRNLHDNDCMDLRN